MPESLSVNEFGLKYALAFDMLKQTVKKMNTKIVYFLLLVLLISKQSFAQENTEMDKAKEEKIWKQKLKKTPPLELKKVSDEYSQLKREEGKLHSEIKAIAAQLDIQDTQAQNLRKQIDSIKAERQGKVMDTDANESDITEKSSHCQGMVFKVQIGVTQQINGSFREEGKAYRLEEDTDGRLVYSLGCFRDREQAFIFHDQLKNIKVSDLYVVLYKDGKRSDAQQIQAASEQPTESESDTEDSGDDW